MKNILLFIIGAMAFFTHIFFVDAADNKSFFGLKNALTSELTNAGARNSCYNPQLYYTSDEIKIIYSLKNNAEESCEDSGELGVYFNYDGHILTHMASDYYTTSLQGTSLLSLLELDNYFMDVVFDYFDFDVNVANINTTVNYEKRYQLSTSQIDVTWPIEYDEHNNPMSATATIKIIYGLNYLLNGEVYEIDEIDRNNISFNYYPYNKSGASCVAYFCEGTLFASSNQETNEELPYTFYKNRYVFDNLKEDTVYYFKFNDPIYGLTEFTIKTLSKEEEEAKNAVVKGDSTDDKAVKEVETVTETTTKTETKTKQEEIKNPNTGLFLPFITLGLMGVVAVYFVKRKRIIHRL